jgi:FAD synthetase
MLHLFTAALARRYTAPLLPSSRIPSIYIPVPSPFPELECFINNSVQSYRLDLFRCSLPEPHGPSSPPLPIESVTRPATPSLVSRASCEGESSAMATSYPVGKARGGEGMRRALETYKERFPHIFAILVGTRRDDPHGGTSNLLPALV